ncbi:uncharacterized protein TNIN_440681 [Trichonephila inaurata madagascariensis]|uniref:C-type lectin domain-containing protein n=1 Tax=Trichonephila inaurata madagascariensis TaxID=2747483 RepID=A0A8X7CHT8_9ARAC|nr:uncharacterized protein TNIN_440681 [Trichonephila inaurata madagascariensis]
MNRRCWFVFLWLRSVVVYSLDCPYTYFPLESENICIYMSSRPVALRDMEGYCATEANGGKPFTRRFSDAGIKELSKTLKMSVESLFPPEVYIGIQREKDSMQQDTKYFAYTNNEGNVHQDDYPLWTDDPSRFDCGVASYLDDFKVKPFSCGNTAVFLCEKNEQPCSDTALPFVEYHQHCLGIFPRKENYRTSTTVCEQLGAHLFPYKTFDDSDSVGAAIYSSLTFDGGIYAGVMKNEMGEWKYSTGEKETSRWDPEDELRLDCGVYAFLKNLSIGMFAMSCESNLRLLCEYVEISFATTVDWFYWPL